jgi:hypothetical protein
MWSIFKSCLWMAPFASLVLGASPASAAHACYNNFVLSDWKTGDTAPKAREKARASWNERARKLTGVPRINWNGAADHQWICEQYGVFGRVKCRGKARPCIG